MAIQSSVNQILASIGGGIMGVKGAYNAHKAAEEKKAKAAAQAATAAPAVASAAPAQPTQAPAATPAPETTAPTPKPAAKKTTRKTTQRRVLPPLEASRNGAMRHMAEKAQAQLAQKKMYKELRGQSPTYDRKAALKRLGR